MPGRVAPGKTLGRWWLMSAEGLTTSTCERDTALQRRMDDDRFYARLFAVLLLAVVAVATIAIVRPFAAPITWAMLLAFILHPTNVRLRRRLHDRRNLAALAATGAVLLVVALPATFITVAFVTQAAALIKRIAESGVL